MLWTLLACSPAFCSTSSSVWPRTTSLQSKPPSRQRRDWTGPGDDGSLQEVTEGVNGCYSASTPRLRSSAGAEWVTAPIET